MSPLSLVPVFPWRCWALPFTVPAQSYILFDDEIIGALIDSATKITLIDWGRLPLRLNLFFQLWEPSLSLHAHWVTLQSKLTVPSAWLECIILINAFPSFLTSSLISNEFWKVARRFYTGAVCCIVCSLSETISFRSLRLHSSTCACINLHV